MPNEKWFPWTAHQLGTPFRDLQLKWDEWFLRRCTSQDYARYGYVHFAEIILKRNNIYYKDPKQDKLESEWTECIKEQRTVNNLNANDEMVMKLI